MTLGGDDDVDGYQLNDYIDAGDGTDTVEGNRGTDTCLNAEQITNCEG